MSKKPDTKPKGKLAGVKVTIKPMTAKEVAKAKAMAKSGK